jgi:hypothetical protein
MICYLTEEKLTQIYNGVRSELKDKAYAKHTAENHWRNCTRPQWLYKAACGLPGSRISDLDIVDSVFGEGFLEGVASSVASSYYFWQIAAEWSIAQQIAEPFVSPQKAVARTRSNYRRWGLDMQPAIDRNLSASQAVRLSSIGAVLWEPIAEDWVVNPLFLKKDGDVKP